MMRSIVRSAPFVAVLVVSAFALAGLGCAPHYVADNFATYQARTKVVAIAPVANLAGKPEAAQAARMIREAIYYELSRRSSKYTVEIQDIAETDKRIQESGQSDSAVAILPGPDICRIIGADAVMKGTITRYEKKSGGNQAAQAAVNFLVSGMIGAKGSEVKADVAIYDGTDGKLIWQHNIEKAGGLFSSPDALRNELGNTVAAKFPYKRKG